MAHIFYPKLNDLNLTIGDNITISQEDCPHLFSFRPRAGETFCITTFKETFYTISITQYDKQRRMVSATVLDQHFITLSDQFDLMYSIAIAVPDKHYLEKCLELCAFFPVDTIHLFSSERSKPLPKNIDRLKGILTRSCEQCQRATLPHIKIHTSLEEICALNNSNKTVFHTQQIRNSHSVQQSNYEQNQNIYIFGPEGGFTSKEIDICLQHGVSVLFKPGIIYPTWASILLIPKG